MQTEIDGQLRANMLLSVCYSFYQRVLKTQQKTVIVYRIIGDSYTIIILSRARV